MVALKKYTRIEASGLWRADADAQRLDVIVVLGDATLTIKTGQEKPLSHWSLAAIERVNPGKSPAMYHPEGDTGELLELDEGEREMVEAIETLRRAVNKARPHPGRLRWLGFSISALMVAALAVFWLPGALREHALRVVPDVGRAQIGQDLLARLERVSGPVCGTSENHSSLARFSNRLGAPKLAVLRGGSVATAHLPGGRILMARGLVEDHETPDVPAGYVLAEQLFLFQSDPLRDVLNHAGTLSTFRLLTTGRLDEKSLDSYAETLLVRGLPAISDTNLLSHFEAAEIPSTPYAYARDITGESVLGLIEADPMRNETARQVLSDSDWLRLQSICG